MTLHFVRRASLACAALVIAVAGCRSTTGSDDTTSPAELALAQSKWTALHASSYSFEVRPLCFCDNRPIRGTVVNGVLTERVYIDTGEAVPATYFTGLQSVEAMFATLADAFQQHANQIHASYDSRGVPLTASIDYQANVFDEEFGWQVISVTLAN